MSHSSFFDIIDTHNFMYITTLQPVNTYTQSNQTPNQPMHDDQICFIQSEYPISSKPIPLTRTTDDVLFSGLSYRIQSKVFHRESIPIDTIPISMVHPTSPDHRISTVDSNQCFVSSSRHHIKSNLYNYAGKFTRVIYSDAY